MDFTCSCTLSSRDAFLPLTHHITCLFPPRGERSFRFYPPVPASEEKEVASESEETFSWKNVLKDVLRLRKEDKLSEGNLDHLIHPILQKLATHTRFAAESRSCCL